MKFLREDRENQNTQNSNDQSDCIDSYFYFYPTNK